jgi:hypothetical protein
MAHLAAAGHRHSGPGWSLVPVPKKSWSSTLGGSRRNTIPSSWIGKPFTSRRKIFGGVRTAIRTRLAPPSTRSDGNFSAAVPRANNQHVLVVIRLRIAVVHRMNHWSIECARPPRQMRAVVRTVQ